MRYLVAVIVCLFYYSINVFAIDVDLNEFIVNGCTDIAACNYDPLADTDDGTCSYDDADNDGVCDDDEILGCTFAVACNYNSAATDNDSCEYIADGECDCDGNVLDPCGVCGGDGEDVDCDGICDSVDDCIASCENPEEDCAFQGCMDPENPAYNPIATYEEEGDCLVGGCNLPDACNYDVDAEYLLPGACEFSTCDGCMDAEACNYDITATLPNSSTCTYALAFYDCEGICLDDDSNGICDIEEFGCLDETACNYNSTATDSDDCLFTDGVCETCSGEQDGTGTIVDNDSDNDGLCNVLDVVSGCTDASACNYNSSSTINSDNSICILTDGVCESCSGEQDGTGTL